MADEAEATGGRWFRDPETGALRKARPEEDGGVKAKAETKPDALAKSDAKNETGSKS